MGQSTPGIVVAVYSGVALAMLAGLYTLYDLLFPNHFTGDMYGLEATVRAVPLIVAALVFAVGSALCIRAVLRSQRPSMMALSFLMVAAIVLVTLAADTARSRHQWATRTSYSAKSIAELLDIARQRDGQFAVYALGSKGKQAVSGLRDLLLDETASRTVRQVAAQALGNIAYAGTPEAVTALEEARTRIGHADVRRAIEYALESVRRSRP